jgi:hypothetical protein
MPYKYPSLRTTLPVAGYYARLDTGAAASDQFTADGTQDGTLTNGATRASDDGLAYSLDGVNDYILSSQLVPTGATARTVSFWFKCTGTINTRQFLLYAGSNFAYTRFAIEIESSKINFNYQIAARVHTTTLVANTWYHVAVTYNGGTSVSIFLNGSKQTFTMLSALNTGSDSTYLGVAFNLTFPFAGLIDDFLVWNNIALSDTNIGYLASQRGAIYQQIAGGGPINGQSLIRPAGSAQQQLLIQGATT